MKIDTEEKYKAALTLVEAAIEEDPDPESAVGVFLVFLAGLIEEYEEEHYPRVK